MCAGVDNARSIPTVTRLAAAIAVLFVLAACGGESAPQPEATRALPISPADLQAVVNVICLETTADMQQILTNVQKVSEARFKRVLNGINATCPDRGMDLLNYIAP